MFHELSFRTASVLALALTLGCSSDGSGSNDGSGGGGGTGAAGGTGGSEGTSSPWSVEQLTAGNGINLAAATSSTLPAGWIEAEYAVAGTAVSYAGETPANGMFALQRDGSADYRTRIVVRRPESATDFNGTVVVEWLNVSGGIDANPDYVFMTDELVRGGYAWVGVSAQHIGIEGGTVLVGGTGSDDAGKGLRTLDPERYDSLSHPGDAYAYDIFTEVARVLKHEGSVGVLGELVPERVLAVGESQSGFMLTTYVNGVHPLAQQYDGFLIHSRGGGHAPLGEPDAAIDLISALSLPPTLIRDDLDVPVLMLETETDLLFLLDYFPARQPDTDHIRTWEIAGSAHADQYLLGGAADAFDCGVAINDGPQHLIVKAALRHLDSWAGAGSPPPAASRLEIDDSASPAVFVRDADGIVQGGIRTPLVDVPVDVLSGAPVAGSVACTLFGSTTPLAPARISELYASEDAYLGAFTTAADAAISAGFVLEDDREALLSKAQPERVP